MSRDACGVDFQERHDQISRPNSHSFSACLGSQPAGRVCAHSLHTSESTLHTSSLLI